MLDTPDAPAARAGPQYQDILHREAQNVELQLENAAVVGGHQLARRARAKIAFSSTLPLTRLQELLKMGRLRIRQVALLKLGSVSLVQ